jgi:hypothetical protein
MGGWGCLGTGGVWCASWQKIIREYRYVCTCGPARSPSLAAPGTRVHPSHVASAPNIYARKTPCLRGTFSPKFQSGCSKRKCPSERPQRFIHSPPKPRATAGCRTSSGLAAGGNGGATPCRSPSCCGCLFQSWPSSALMSRCASRRPRAGCGSGCPRHQTSRAGRLPTSPRSLRHKAPRRWGASPATSSAPAPWARVLSSRIWAWCWRWSPTSTDCTLPTPSPAPVPIGVLGGALQAWRGGGWWGTLPRTVSRPVAVRSVSSSASAELGLSWPCPSAP